MITGDDATKALLAGVNKVATAVKGTLGPAATTVILEREDNFPVVLNDGVSIAKAIKDKDAYVNMGVNLIQQVASEAQNSSGDGTTTATILAQALCNLGVEEIKGGTSTRTLLETLTSESEQIIKAIKEQAVECEDDMLDNVACIASNNDAKLGALIAEIMRKVGKDGVVSVEVGSGFDTTYEMANGFEIHSSTISPHFPKSMDDVNVLLCYDRINSFEQLLPALEQSIQENRGLLIIANDVNARLLPNLLINVMQGKVNATIIKTPEMGRAQENWMLDIQSIVGGPIYGKIYDMDISKVGVHGMGHALSMEMKKDTTILKTDSPPNEKHLDDLYQALDDEELIEWEKEILQRRIGRLSNGVAAIKVGGYTELELLETKERVDDAVNAVKEAMNGGVVRGGGLTMYAAFRLSASPWIVQAFSIPHHIILENAGLEPKFDSGKAMNALTGNLEDYLSAGVLDPVNVVVNSIRSAVSIAKLVLGSQCLVPMNG